jgi:3-deoxy-D-manno-octulosonic-acid transferase
LEDNRSALLLYRALASLALLVYSPFALLRSVARKARPGDLRGRFGLSDYPDLSDGIWIHAVSVGEIGVAKSLCEAIRRRAPRCRIGLSVTTAAGRELADRAFSGEAPVFAFPFDLAGPVERALDATRPALVVVTETELWPLFLERAERRGIPVALVNGRISERSWRRYRLVRRWFARSLARIALFAMQSEEDARRIRSLGAPKDRVRSFGNLKYDVAAAPKFVDADRLRSAAGRRPIVVAGSTGDGEEDLVLDAWAGASPRGLLVLAPRRPERFDEVAALVERRGLRLLRRTGADASTSHPDSPPAVYLLDSIGELASVYAEAAVAFVGGSLVESGGHNPIEAWAAGVPVLAGPHMDNFREVAARGEALGILRRVSDPAALRREIEAALAGPEDASRRGAEAARFVRESRGAADRTAEAVLALAPAVSGGRGSAS